MKKGFFVFLTLLFCFCKSGFSQTLRTGVVVIGNGNNAVSAAIQSAVSGAKTVWLLPTEEIVLSPLQENLHAGVASEFLSRLRKMQGIADSTAVPYFDNATAGSVIKQWTDSLKNLTLIRKAIWTKLGRSGNGWSVELRDGKTVKADVLINADLSDQVSRSIGTRPVANPWQALNYDNNSFRTSLASGVFLQNGTAHVLPLSSLIDPQQQNLVNLPPDPQSFAEGQAAGAVAAYAAFYHVKTQEANLKVVQGELVRYKQALVPFADVPLTDSNWNDIQFVGLSGILKAELDQGHAYFRPEKEVSTDEVRAMLKAYYYKAQIWFDDHEGAEMTLGNTLDMICTVGHKSLSHTTEQVRKSWKTSYHFASDFDLKRRLSRREFAVLINDYLRPFNVLVDPSGRVLR